MRKIQLFGALAVLVVLLSGFVVLDVSATDRTPYFGILISAWTCDDYSITPAMAKAMIDEAYTRKGIEFQAVKITYGYDPNTYSASYVAGRINTWVDYFADYYDHIYVASRSVFHTGEQLTSGQAGTYYGLLADYLNDYPEVECFLGEEEAEAEQSCPHCGEPTGNNLAYDDFDDMVDYIDMLYDTWHSYSDISFSFESITPANEFYNASGHYYTNAECWFFEEVEVTEYWAFINAYQDIFALDEWRWHWGAEEWRDHCSVYNEYMEVDKGFFFGETFNLDYTETEDLIDAWSGVGSGYCDFNYAFWWSLVAVEPIYTQCPSYDDYFYWTGGWEGHAWAHLQKKQWGSGWGDYLCSFNTYSDGSNDVALATDGVVFNTDPTEEYFRVYFNIDMYRESVGSGNEALLGYWVSLDGYYYAITMVCDSNDDLHLKYYYVEEDEWHYPVQASYYASGYNVPKNAWVYADIKHEYADTAFRYCVFFANDTNTGVQTFYTAGGGFQGQLAMAMVACGVMGGNFVKLYLGEMDYYSPYGDSLMIDFESGAGSLSGWDLSYTEPSYVHVDNYLVYDNAPHWMFTQMSS